jgi:hypothetical protein
LREGAAAIALMAARKSERPIAILPVAIKRWYLEDPTPSLCRTAEKMELRLGWNAQSHLPMTDRILSIAEQVLSQKETEILGQRQQGTLQQRIALLTEEVLKRAEAKYLSGPPKKLIPERIKEIRRILIAQIAERADQAPLEQRKEWDGDMESMFLATQLYSYPGDYLTESPTWERQAETLDKLEEDFLGANYPTSHGRKTVHIRFGEPILLPEGKQSKSMSPDQLTMDLQQGIQAMLDLLNRKHSDLSIRDSRSNTHV